MLNVSKLPDTLKKLTANANYEMKKIHRSRRQNKTK